MATVTLVFEDRPDGTVKVSVGGDKEPSDGTIEPSRVAASIAMGAVLDACDDETPGDAN